jgi:hypothetical protein
MALGPVSLSVLGRPTIGVRHPSLAAPTIPPPDLSRGLLQGEVEPTRTNENVFNSPAGSDRIGDGGFVPTARGKLYDFTGSGKTDWTFLTFTTGSPFTWHVMRNPAVPGPAFQRVFDFGVQGTDSIRPQDYIGDTRSEVTVRRTGVYYSAQVPTGTGGMTLSNTLTWGLSTDASGGEGDYDGDMKIDYTVVRVTANVLSWYILLSGTNTLRVVPFGQLQTGLTTVLLNGADFNGDGRDELCFAQYNATANPAPTTWYAADAVSGAGVLTATFGDFQTMNAMPPSDYTGDGKADLMEVKLDGTLEVWYMRNNATQTFTATTFGKGDPAFVDYDFPLRGDYDGDGISDIAVWRQLEQTYYVKQSSNGSINAQNWGISIDDVPLAVLGSF